jgi:protein-disulfide isomerase
MGPDNAEVTVLYFGDYECPYCAKADLDLGALREEFPENLAVVFLHFPLATHPRSHALARMAECGAHQDSFEAVHSLLFPTDELADAAGDEELPGIEEDKSIGEELGIRSTPRFILQGVLLGASPDSAGLSELVRGHLEKGGL